MDSLAGNPLPDKREVFDKKQRRGVVALCNEPGWSILASAILQRVPLSQENKTQFVREIVGLGFAFDLDQQTHTLRVTKVYPKSSAAQAGLSAGLIIGKIENVPTSGKSVAECLSLLRAIGKQKVRLELVNPDREETNAVELTKQKFLTSD